MRFIQILVCSNSSFFSLLDLLLTVFWLSISSPTRDQNQGVLTNVNCASVKIMTNLDSILKSGDITLPTKVHLVKVSQGFSSGHVWTWELDYKESLVLKNWCFWTVVLEKTLESPLGCKEIQPVHPKGDQSWCSLEGLMLKLKLQYFGHLMWRANSLEKTLMLGKIGGKRRRGWQDEMVGWHHWFNGHGFGWTPGVGDGQGVLACCGSWGRKESDTTEWLNWTELFSTLF